MDKSTMVFSLNNRQEMSSEIRQILPFQVIERFEKYLGLPAHIGQSKVEVFNYLKDRLWAQGSGVARKKSLNSGGKKC